MSFRLVPLLALILALVVPSLSAQQAPPRDNPYDVIGKVFSPFWSVLLAATKSPNKACTMTIEMVEVSGRLPKQMTGATLKAAVQFPDKVKLQAPVLGEEITVCRDGDKVWAYPGAKVEFLLKRFKGRGPPPTKKKNTPLYLPITPQQAIFLPALFTVSRPDVAEIQSLHGEDCRVITAGLMPELARAARAEGFRARMWVAPGYVPRRIEITQPDFVAVTEIKDLRFSPSLPASTWQPPADVSDIYWTNSEMLDSVLFVVMNSLKMTESDQPWLLNR
jgi:outer membrane lipoprotein-sorting protein